MAPMDFQTWKMTTKIPFRNKNRSRPLGTIEEADHLERHYLTVGATHEVKPPDAPRWFDTPAVHHQRLDNIVDTVASAVRFNAGQDLPAIWSSHLLQMIEGYGILKRENAAMRREFQNEKEVVKKQLAGENEAWREEQQREHEALVQALMEKMEEGIEGWKMRNEAQVEELKKENEELKHRLREEQDAKSELLSRCEAQQQSMEEMQEERVVVVTRTMVDEADHDEELPKPVGITVIKKRQVNVKGAAHDKDKDENKLLATPEDTNDRRRVFSFTPGDDNDIFSATPINRTPVPSRDSFESLVNHARAQPRASMESMESAVTVIDHSDKTRTSPQRQKTSARRGSNTLERSLNRIMAITPVGSKQSRKSTSPLRALMMRGRNVSSDIQVY
ncbi:MAG: hypothetical protein M1823_002024 [Watsoniomyces obsoletus]|nr:MAG: hypothetical protein M1823_002024 [Watsoniomyces obsoletus]